jgi:hypothetical protein
MLRYSTFEGRLDKETCFAGSGEYPRQSSLGVEQRFSWSFDQGSGCFGLCLEERGR